MRGRRGRAKRRAEQPETAAAQAGVQTSGPFSGLGKPGAFPANLFQAPFLSPSVIMEELSAVLWKGGERVRQRTGPCLEAC